MIWAILGNYKVVQFSWKKKRRVLEKKLEGEGGSGHGWL